MTGPAAATSGFAQGRKALSACIMVGLLLALAEGNTGAEVLRVTSWNLQAAGSEPLLRTVAEELKSLHPDIILLQGARDWQMCSQLAEMLLPEQYPVLVCSAFANAPDAAGTNSQVAVLAKEKAYFSWAEPWHGPGTGSGFVFAAVQVRGQRLGFFSADAENGPAPEAMLEQLRQQTEAVGLWKENQVKSFVIGLSGGRSPALQAGVSRLAALLQDAGYTDTLDALAADQRATVAGTTGQPARICDFIMAQPSVFPLPIRPRSAVMGRYPVTCELELDAGRVTAAWTARARELQARATAMQPPETTAAAARALDEQRSPRNAENPPAWWWAVGGAMATALLFLLWFISRAAGLSPRPNPPLLVNQAPAELTDGSSYTVVVSAPAGNIFADIEPRSPAVLQPGVPVQGDSAAWEQRALAAERQAAQANLILKQKLSGRLARWLKKKFVRRIVSDRAELLRSQESAAIQAMQVDERLARIEKQIQQQTLSYERRLEELTLELVAAREENRELIRARIAQVKLEMETVRARLRTEAT